MSRCLNLRRATVDAIRHFGIRFTEDLNSRYSEYIIDSVDLLNAQFAPHGMRFFSIALISGSRLSAGSIAGIYTDGQSRTTRSMTSSRFGLQAMTGGWKATTASARAGKTETASRTQSSTASFPRRPTNEARPRPRPLHPLIRGERRLRGRCGRHGDGALAD